MELLGKKWKYISEGNVHIVLQLLGTEHVLRLIKEDKNTTNFSHMKTGVDFVNKVMNPLLKNYYYADEETVELPVEILDELSRNLHNYRPQNRRFKSSISPHAIIASNLAVVSAKCHKNYCIEIKPKEGYLANSLKKYSKCYFCLKQYTKLHLQQIPEVGGYCPLDLFSGNRARMKHALSNLVDNPQNNFKLFQDGSLVYHEKSTKEDFSKIITSTNVFDTMEIFFDFLIDVLVGEAHASDSPYDNKLKLQNKCDESNSLQKDSFLYNLLEVQKITETINVEDIKEINPDYVPTILEKIRNEKLNLYNEHDRGTLFKVLEPTHAALISAVAKDCSIMISFSQDIDENFPFLQVNNHKIVYKLSVTDLEPKSLKSVIKRKETENELIDIYHKYVGKGEIQPHKETREKQLEAWQALIADYLKAAKQSTIDVRESQNSPLFNNVSINRKLSQEAIVTVLEHMAKSGRASPLDKSKNVWEVYWHSLDEWGNMIYSWACDNGLNNSVCTLFELREGEDTADQEFHGLDMNIMIKALKTLEVKGRCEVIDFDDNQGVKFF